MKTARRLTIEVGLELMGFFRNRFLVDLGAELVREGLAMPE